MAIKYEIISEHELEYMTNFEADRKLREYFKVLKPFNFIKITVTNIDYYANLWLKAEWNEETLKNKKSDAQLSFIAFWGEQYDCDPWNPNYNKEYKSVRKSGYNKKRLEFLLKRIGFINIKTVKEDKELIVIASKGLDSGERQVGKTLEEIRLDHVNRYKFASECITKKNSIIIDAACGVGYGSYILSKNKNVNFIQAVDISEESLIHATKYFNSNKIKYIRADLESDDLPVQKADYFISFETIEHLSNPEKFIKKISNLIKKNGIFIGSTPNEEIMPYIKQNFLYHTRHFTEDDLKELLLKYGFSEIIFFQQKKDKNFTISKRKDGEYIIFIAKKG